MPRPSWSGYLRFNLISVPVVGYNAAESGGKKVSFNMIHASCHNRIKYKKVCPVHGEVPNNEIVSGFEVSKGNYVVVGAEEKAELKAEDEKTVSVDAFVPADEFDPLYFSGRSFYLVPDGKVGQKPYKVILEAMRKENCYAIAQVVFSGRNQVAAVRPSGRVLTMSVLNFASELKKPSEFEDEVSEVHATAEEEKLARTLIEASKDEDFDLAQYKDDYQEKLAELVAGKTPKAKAKEEHGNVINLMDALKQSLEKTKKSKPVSQHGAARHRKKTG